MWQCSAIACFSPFSFTLRDIFWNDMSLIMGDDGGPTPVFLLICFGDYLNPFLTECQYVPTIADLEPNKNPPI